MRPSGCIFVSGETCKRALLKKASICATCAYPALEDLLGITTKISLSLITKYSHQVHNGINQAKASGELATPSSAQGRQGVV